MPDSGELEVLLRACDEASATMILDALKESLNEANAEIARLRYRLETIAKLAGAS